MSNENCKSAKQIYDIELTEAIERRRKYWDNKAQKLSPAKAYPSPSDKDLVGLALSGGGIRSAMFNLGLLQAFERSGLMKHVDYLASVSGGGYTNGYYSTLRNSSFSRSEGEKTRDVPSKQLSERDTQFLLDGQYLNRPIEFLTTYLVRTFFIFITVISMLVVFSSLIAMYFRWFDHAYVRTWLNLLDVSNDLRAGLFGCAVAAIVLLALRGIFLGLLWIRGTPFRSNPGQWAVIVIASFLLGIATMIGNGDFAISSGTGWLPTKLDLKSFQLPILVVVMLMFSPFLRFSSLLRSERVNASLAQRIALTLILGGTTWGAVFAMVGWLGQEDVSGYIRNRPPSFVRHDILNYEEFGDVVLSNGELANLLKTETNQDLKKVATEMRDNAKKSRLAEEQLRLDGFEWNSWTDSSNQTISRWLQTAAIRVTCTKDGNVYEHVQNKWEAAEKSQKLTDRIEQVIKPRSIKPINEIVALGSPPADGMVNANEESAYEVNRTLMQLAVRRILFSPTSEKSKVDYDKFLQKGKEEKDKFLKVSASAPDERLEATAAQIISAWIANGAIMPKRQGERYKDLSNFHKLIETCWSTRGSWHPENLSDLQCWQLNRMFLEIAYPTVFKERAMVSTSVVVAQDQSFRLIVLFWSSICLAVCVLLVDLNWVPAWFHFYRKRVRETFLVHADGAGRGKLKDLKPYEIGYPYPLFVAGMILPQAPAYSRNLKSGSAGNNPTKLDGSFASNWYSFLFSPLYCGWLPCSRSDAKSGEPLNAAELPGATERTKECCPLTTYRETKDYSSNLGVDDAVVLSGAAVTPFMSENISMRLLMHLFNFRLEQWMPNPEKVQPSNRRFSLVSMAREWLFSRVGDSRAATWRYAVVADGGFREFLGVEELIARRCKVVIVSDAGCNNGLYEFGVLADLIRKMRLDHRIDILDLDHDRPLDTRRLRRTCELDGKSPQHFVLGRIRYPEKLTKAEGGQTDCNEPNQEALLVYVQMSLTGDEDIDIEQFRRTNPNFPDEPISNQFYSREQVESFRQLGEHIGNLLCRDVSRFDCPTSTTLATIKGDKITPEQRMQEWRIRKLEDAFRSSYRNECRQEASVADDDARMGWILDVGHIDDSTRKKVHQFESTAEHNHQLLIRDFVWKSLDKIESELENQFEQITPADIFGIAVECNRRHAGFRPEWPTSFFQVGGRDLLTKAAQKAESLLSPNQSGRDGIDDFVAWFSGKKQDVPGLISSLSRLAVMLPRGVFRKNGCRTAAEVIACLLNYIIRIRLMKTDSSMDWVSSERAQRILSKAIRTGRANEVESALLTLLSQKTNIPPRVNVNAVHE